MTSPVSHGFPDWGRQRAASDISILSITNQVANPTIQSDVLFVGNMPYMFVEAVTAGRMAVDITWFADAGGIDNLGGDRLATPTGGDATVCIPVRGPYVRFDITATPAPQNVNLRVFMTPTRFNVQTDGQGNSTLITANGVILGAGANVTLSATVVRAGWGRWGGVLAGSTNMQMRLESVDFNGTVRLYDVIDSSGARTGGLVYVPALPMQIVIINGDPAAHAYHVALSVHPFLT